jgi:hypothetical protein
LNWFKKLVNDRFTGKLGINSTKIQGFRELYPDLLERKKSTGFEKIDHIVDEFELHILKKYKRFPWRNVVERDLNQFYVEITGNEYIKYQ